MRVWLKSHRLIVWTTVICCVNLNIVKTSKAFKGYTHSYSVEVRVGDKS